MIPSQKQVDKIIQDPLASQIFLLMCSRMTVGKRTIKHKNQDINLEHGDVYIGTQWISDKLNIPRSTIRDKIENLVKLGVITKHRPRLKVCQCIYCLDSRQKIHQFEIPEITTSKLVYTRPTPP